MHHPGPPRFAAVGESVELAPRDPDLVVPGDPDPGTLDALDPATTCRWSLVERPDGSSPPILPDDPTPVVHLAPDIPGRYGCRLTTPDETYHVTVRAFPDPRRSVRFAVPVTALPVHDSGAVSVVGRFNEYVVGRDRPQREGDEYVFETRLPPGEHPFAFVVGDDFETAVGDTLELDGPGRPRVQLDARVDDSTAEVLVTAVAHAGSDGETPTPTVEFHLDDRDGLSRTDVVIEGDGVVGTGDMDARDGSSVTTGAAAVDERDASGASATLRLPVAAVSTVTRVHAVAVGARHSVADTVRLVPASGGPADAGARSDGSSVRVEHPTHPPAWLSMAVVYEAFVRAFAPDEGFGAIAQRVPYLADLGVDCLWLTPVLAGPTDHGYEITDYYRTAEDLGSRADFERLVERCRQSGIRVVFDLVVNHTGEDHSAFRAWKEGDPAYRNWYVATDDGHEHYFDWGPLPNLNHDSLSVRRFVLDVVDEWAPLVDGFRCDVAWGVPHGLWKEIRARVKARDPGFILLDEVIPRDPAYHENEFDLHFDTTLYEVLRAVGRGEQPASALVDAALAPPCEGFPDHAGHPHYVETHDERRYREECGEGALRAAVATTFCLPGVPMVCAGQERGLDEPREPLDWDGDPPLVEFHRELAALRRARPVLREGTLDRVAWKGTDRTVAFARTATETDATGDDRLVVVCHFGERVATVLLDERCSEVVFGDATLVRASAGTRVRVSDVAVLR